MKTQPISVTKNQKHHHKTVYITAILILLVQLSYYLMVWINQ